MLPLAIIFHFQSSSTIKARQFRHAYLKAAIRSDRSIRQKWAQSSHTLQSALTAALRTNQTSENDALTYPYLHVKLRGKLRFSRDMSTDGTEQQRANKADT
ncbi:MAG: hypothetical protein ABJ263_05325 [Tateyamaria sp.]|uniref:hypothetical protein n=1 Tax=Tateyamaria sp. TaxID=1929288 RepID=UPI00328A9A3B